MVQVIELLNISLNPPGISEVLIGMPADQAKEVIAPCREIPPLNYEGAPGQLKGEGELLWLLHVDLPTDTVSSIRLVRDAAEKESLSAKKAWESLHIQGVLLPALTWGAVAKVLDTEKIGYHLDTGEAETEASTFIIKLNDYQVWLMFNQQKAYQRKNNWELSVIDVDLPLNNTQ